MSYIYNNALYSTAGGQGFYKLSSANGEITATNNNTFTAAYTVVGNGYNQDSFTVNGTTVKPTSAYTFTVFKYNNGVACSPNSTTYTVTVSSTAAIPMALLLSPAGTPFTGGHRATLAVPYNIPANANGLGTTYVDVDLSAATQDFSDPERRRLVSLGYIA